jgi:predicted nicotinamide N-methyase
VPLVPELRLYLADTLVPLWETIEWTAAAPQPPPFWAFAWPGSQAIARFLLDSPDVVRGKRVLDFGAGSGLAAIGAARLGAAEVAAWDLDPRAAVVQTLNAALNAVSLTRRTGDALAFEPEVDVILAGDVCYEREPSDQIIAWLRRASARGAEVLLADPGRHYAPADGLDLLARYEVPTLRELESPYSRQTRLWRLRASVASR